MAVDTEDAAQRFADGIDPYVSVYNETRNMTNSQDVQDAFLEVKEEELDKEGIVDRFVNGYSSERDPRVNVSL